MRETARRIVRPGAIVFLDESGRPVRRTTARVRFSVEFPAGEGTGTLRECGLFGGEATDASGSGTLLSYHVHPRIEKGASDSLRRDIHIDLTPRPFAPGSRVTRWLGNTRSGEVHDLDARTPNCQIDEIRLDRRFYFAGLEEAARFGYDPCAYCLGEGSEPSPALNDTRPPRRPLLQ